MTTILITALTFIWSGLILGLSFIEAPLKFKAPHITLKLGLGIGKIIFQTLNKLELVFALLIVIGLFLEKVPSKIWIFYLIPLSILLLQTLWLLPVLDARLDAILRDKPVANSQMHILFIVLEGIKLIALWVSATLFVKSKML